MKSGEPVQCFATAYLKRGGEGGGRGERGKTYVAGILARAGMRLKIPRKWMYRYRVAGRDVDDRGRWMRAAPVSLGFSMHVECTGDETLFTSYTSIGNSRGLEPPRCALAATFREKRLSPEGETYTTRCRMWRTFSM